MIPKDTGKLLEALGKNLPPIGAKGEFSAMLARREKVNPPPFIESGQIHVPGPVTSLACHTWKRTTIITGYPGDQRPGRINRNLTIWQRMKHRVMKWCWRKEIEKMD